MLSRRFVSSYTWMWRCAIKKLQIFGLRTLPPARINRDDSALLRPSESGVVGGAHRPVRASNLVPRVGNDQSPGGLLPRRYPDEFLIATCLAKYWSGRRDSNPRPRPWQGRALPLSYTRILQEPANGWPPGAPPMPKRAADCNTGNNASKPKGEFKSEAIVLLRHSAGQSVPTLSVLAGTNRGCVAKLRRTGWTFPPIQVYAAEPQGGRPAFCAGVSSRYAVVEKSRFHKGAPRKLGEKVL
jgi:hypothetical protein